MAKHGLNWNINPTFEMYVIKDKLYCKLNPNHYFDWWSDWL